MITEYNVGDEVFFKGTISKIEITPDGKELYIMSEYPDIKLSPDSFLKTATVGLRVDKTELEIVRKEVENLKTQLREANLIIEKLNKDKEEIELTVGFKFEGKEKKTEKCEKESTLVYKPYEMLTPRELDTTDLVDELEMREGVSSIFVGPSNKTDIKVDGPAVVLIVVD